MKLSEALSLRKELVRKIGRLESRLQDNIRTPEGEEPEEDPADLRAQIKAALDDQERLVLQINLTNVFTQVGDAQQTITSAIAHRDRLNQEIKLLDGVIQSGRRQRGYGEERTLRYKTHLSLSDLQKERDNLSKELRELDDLIQRANFDTELAALPAA